MRGSRLGRWATALQFFLVVVVVNGHPQENKYGLSRVTCRAKWDQCLNGDELSNPEEEPKPTPGECEVIIRRRYDCGVPVEASVNRGQRQRVEESGQSSGTRKEPWVRTRVQPESDLERDSRTESKPVRYDGRGRGRVAQEERGPPPRAEEEDDAPSVEIIQNRRTVKDDRRSKYSKVQGTPVQEESVDGRPESPPGERPVSLDAVRRRDKVRKEKERIFVKEDIIELDENKELDKLDAEKEVQPNPGQKNIVKQMKIGTDGESKGEEAEEEEKKKHVGSRVVKMLQRGLL